MKLLPKSVEKIIPKIGTSEKIKNGALRNVDLVVKFFTPYSDWTWYVAEGNREEDGNFSFFGYVDGTHPEWGYFMLDEMQELADEGKIERDILFEKIPAHKILP